MALEDIMVWSLCIDSNWESSQTLHFCAGVIYENSEFRWVKLSLRNVTFSLSPDRYASFSKISFGFSFSQQLYHNIHEKY